MSILEEGFEKRLTRPPAQRERILADLRGGILSGRLAPGERLPSRAELFTLYNVSPVTLQRAMSRLLADGFIKADATGTRVSRRPPHLSRFGIVFPNRDTKAQPWGRFQHALSHGATLIEKEMDVELPVFYSGDENSDRGGLQLLQRTVSSQALAGLFLVHPFYLLGTPVMEQSHVPLVRLDSPHAPKLPALRLDWEDHLCRALDYFVTRGRRRLAVLTAGHFWRDRGAGMMAAAARHGVELRPQWTHCITLYEPQWARNLTHLLFSGGDRPDAMLVADDNLVEAAIDGLLDAGMRVPEDVAVLCHRNFPDRSAPRCPVDWIGYDARDILRQFIGMATEARQGKSVSDQLIRPCFESDVITSKQCEAKGGCHV